MHKICLLGGLRKDGRCLEGVEMVLVMDIEFGIVRFLEVFEELLDQGLREENMVKEVIERIMQINCLLPTK